MVHLVVPGVIGRSPSLERAAVKGRIQSSIRPSLLEGHRATDLGDGGLAGERRPAATAELVIAGQRVALKDQRCIRIVLQSNVEDRHCERARPELPEPVAVQVTVVTPSGKQVPEAGAQLTVAAQPPVAVGVV